MPRAPRAPAAPPAARGSRAAGAAAARGARPPRRPARRAARPPAHAAASPISNLFQTPRPLAGSTAYPTAYDDAYSDVSRSRPALLDVLANDQTCGGRVTDIQGPFGVDEGVRAGTLNSDGRRVRGP